MQVFLFNTFDCFVALFFLYLLVHFRDRRRRGGLPYPPGPPSWPIIGNLLDIPKDLAWTAYADMSKKHGDIICLRVYSEVAIVLCSLSAIKDILEKRGKTYSERRYFPIIEMMDMEWPLFMTGTTETWRKGRKILDGNLRPGAMVSYRQIMEEKTRDLLAQLCATPKNFHAHLKFLQANLIMTLTYGYNLKKSDKMLEAPEKALEMLTPVLQPGALLVNHFPFLRFIPSWVPHISYEPLAQIARKLSERIKNEPIDFVKNSLYDGTAGHSLAAEHLQELEELIGSERQMQEEVIKVLVLTPTIETISSMTSLFLALVLFPHTQKRAQTELDLVVGRDRLPTFDDRPRLPYIEAFCKEVMRWLMVTPMAIPHTSTRDDVYRGFFIPKGSTVIANAWAILHDPELYPDPEEFKPERFLNEDGSVRDDPTLSLAFGIGKRIVLDVTSSMLQSSFLPRRSSPYSM
ncbi:cytochrome P450 [Russula aff. rugulosa BPL654]|nr:cytochrome P450 [Russula aff. rugulosa BPL654]